MKKRMIILTVLCMVLLLAAPSFALGENSAPASLQLQFAQFQMEQAEAVKQRAMEYLAQVEQLKAEQMTAAGYIAQASQLQADASSNGTSTAMPDTMKSYMDEHNLQYDMTGGDAKHTADEWKVALQSLQAYREQLGTQAQTLMIFVQDYLGQYSSYMQNDANKTLTSIALGQSLFSTEGGAISPTLIVTSIVVGVAFGMFIMWLLLRKKACGKAK